MPRYLLSVHSGAGEATRSDDRRADAAVLPAGDGPPGGDEVGGAWVFGGRRAMEVGEVSGPDAALRLVQLWTRQPSISMTTTRTTPPGPICWALEPR